MAALREILAVFDIIVQDQQLDAADKKLDSFVDKLKGIGAAFAAFGIIKSIASFGEHVAASAREVKFHAQRMEMDTDEYQKMSQVAKDYGITTEQLQIANTIFTRGLSSMGGTMGEFSARTNQAQEGMRNLHLDARQFRGQKLEQILPVIADAMQKVDDPMERVAIGIRLFGHRGRAMMQLMAVGGDEMRRAFAAAVPVFEKATIESANKATVAGNQLSRTWDNLVNNSFGKALLDAFTWTARKLTDIVLVMKELTKHSEIGKGILIALAIASTVAAGMVIAAWWPVLLPIAAIVAAFAALALIIDDLIVFMEGGDSVTGDLLDHFFGPGGADKFRETVQGMWKDVKDFFADESLKAGKAFFEGIRDFSREIRDDWRKINEYWQLMKVDLDKIGHFFGGGSSATSTVDTIVHRTLYPSAPEPLIPVPAPRNLSPEIGTAPVLPDGTPASIASPTYNIHGNIDSGELVNKIKQTVSDHGNQKLDVILRDALSGVGGSQ